MSTGTQIYRRLCAARNLDAAVARLSRDELAAVAVELSGMTPTGGVPAQVFGMVSARLSAGATRRHAPRRKTSQGGEQTL